MQSIPPWLWHLDKRKTEEGFSTFQWFSPFDGRKHLCVPARNQSLCKSQQCALGIPLQTDPPGGGVTFAGQTVSQSFWPATSVGQSLPPPPGGSNLGQPRSVTLMRKPKKQGKFFSAPSVPDCVTPPPGGGGGPGHLVSQSPGGGAGKAKVCPWGTNDVGLILC